MFTILLAAARYKLYVAIAMAAWSTLYPHGAPKEAPIVADAIAWAVLDAPSELPDDLQNERLVATMAVYAARETDLRAHPCAGRKDSGCADGGLAGGYWQLHQSAGWRGARDQAAAWIELVRQARRMCGTGEAALAMTLSGHCNRGRVQTAKRLQAVETVLQVWNASEKADGAPASADTALALPSTGQSTTSGRSADRTGDPTSARSAIGSPGAEL